MKSLRDYLNQKNERKMQREEAIATAVNWWADAICYPEFDDGRMDMNSRIAAAMSSVLSIECKAQEEQILIFKEYLTNAIKKELKRKHTCTLSVDYEPEGILADAKEQANIKTPFPWKTDMWVNEQEVRVRKGYHREVLYDAKDSIENAQETHVKKLSTTNK